MEEEERKNNIKEWEEKYRERKEIAKREAVAGKERNFRIILSIISPLFEKK